MNFTLFKGKDFRETFDFKNSQGKSIALPPGNFSVVLERGGFAKEYTVANGGLTRSYNSVGWKIAKEDSSNFEFTTMYYTLYLEDREITRGLLRIS
jgi:hypothetical protein